MPTVNNQTKAASSAITVGAKAPTVMDAKGFYKPFQYPWAFQYYQTQNKMHWVPEEVSLHSDVKDWKTRLLPEEQFLLTQLFRFFTTGDVDIGQAYIDKYMATFRNEEVRMMLGAFMNMESVHAEAYSLLMDTVGMPESEYKAFKKYDVMAAKHDYLLEFDISDELSVARALAVYSAFTEGLQLFSTFAILMNFQRFGKMRGMCVIVEYSIKDESLHVEAMIKLYRTYMHEHPHLDTPAFKADIAQICQKMVQLEDDFIDMAFSMGAIEGLTSDEVKSYIRFIANRRMMQLGMEPIYAVEKNPLGWLDHIMSAVVHTSFFESRPTEYAKGALTGTWDAVWASVDSVNDLIQEAAENSHQIMEEATA